MCLKGYVILVLAVIASADIASAGQLTTDRLPNTSSGADSAIVVSSERIRETAEAFVNQVQNPEQESDEPLARFTDAVCVGAAGLPVGAAQAVVDRVTEVALSVGLRTGGSGCYPNIMVVFTDDPKEAMRTLRRNRSGAVNGQTRAAIARIIDEPGSARSWIEVETRSRDGEKLQLAPNQPAILNISSQSRLVSPLRRDIVSATVLIERSAIGNRSLRQIADYAAVRALSGARGHSGLEASSILSTFTPEGDDQAPAEMTSFDRGYLHGLYAGTGNILPRMKKHQIARYIVEELGR